MATEICSCLELAAAGHTILAISYNYAYHMYNIGSITFLYYTAAISKAISDVLFTRLSSKTLVPPDPLGSFPVHCKTNYCCK